MNDHRQFEGASNPHGDYTKLARWLQHVLQEPAQVTDASAVEEGDMQLGLLLGSGLPSPFLSAVA